MKMSTTAATITALHCISKCNNDSTGTSINDTANNSMTIAIVL